MKLYELTCVLEDVIDLVCKKMIQRKLPIKYLPYIFKYKFLVVIYKRKFKKTAGKENKVPHGSDLEKALNILYPWTEHYESELMRMKQELENL